MTRMTRCSARPFRLCRAGASQVPGQGLRSSDLVSLSKGSEAVAKVEFERAAGLQALRE
jgi:hypothetical protein